MAPGPLSRRYSGFRCQGYPRPPSGPSARPRPSWRVIEAWPPDLARNPMENRRRHLATLKRGACALTEVRIGMTKGVVQLQAFASGRPALSAIRIGRDQIPELITALERALPQPATLNRR